MANRRDLVSPTKRIKHRLSNAVKGSARHRVDLTAANLGGAIFGCTRTTLTESLETRIFCLPMNYSEVMLKVKKGHPIFLYDFESKLFYGSFKAECDGAMVIVNEKPTKVPCKVKVSSEGQNRRTLRLDQVSKYLNVGVPEPNLFYLDLDAQQVEKLTPMFKKQKKAGCNSKGAS